MYSYKAHCVQPRQRSVPRRFEPAQFQAARRSALCILYEANLHQIEKRTPYVQNPNNFLKRWQSVMRQVIRAWLSLFISACKQVSCIIFRKLWQTEKERERKRMNEWTLFSFFSYFQANVEYKIQRTENKIINYKNAKRNKNKLIID